MGNPLVSSKPQSKWRIAMILLAVALSAVLANRFYDREDKTAVPATASPVSVAPESLKNTQTPSGSVEAVFAPKSLAVATQPSKNHTFHVDRNAFDSAQLPGVIPVLRADADRGNIRAACYLGIALDRCRASGEAAKRAYLSAEEDPDRSKCTGVSADDLTLASSYLLRAAQSGQEAAIVRYVTTPPLSEEAFTTQLDGWREYSELAPSLLQSALAKGNVPSLYFAYFAAVGGPTPGGVVLVKPDLYAAAMYAQSLTHVLTGDALVKVQRWLTRNASASTTDKSRWASSINSGEVLFARSFSASAKLGAVTFGTNHPNDCE